MAFRNTISHKKCFNRTSGSTFLSEKDLSVEQCMRLIILTSKGELLGDPEFGTNIYEYLLMSNTDVIAELTINDILTGINTYEKRVQVSRDDISFNIDRNTVHINIQYLLLQTGTVETFTLEMSRRKFNV